MRRNNCPPGTKCFDTALVLVEFKFKRHVGRREWFNNSPKKALAAYFKLVAHVV